MANQELYDKQYKIPSDVLKYIQTVLVSYPSGDDGIKRAKFMLNNGSITYQAMKRLKNFFDYFNPETQDKVSYALAGGDLMKQFIETSLAQDRAGVARSKETKRDMTTNPNSELMPYQITEEKKEKKEEKQKNALAVIVNDDNKILLLKRGKDAPWMSEKWSLVGGGVEKGETPQAAVEREIFEEIGIEINKFIKTFSIQRNPESIETVFACRFDGDTSEIELDTNENTNYGWYDLDEMKFLDTVPNLVEYITLSFTGKKYND